MDNFTNSLALIAALSLRSGKTAAETKDLMKSLLAKTGPIRLIHYSPSTNLKQIDPSFHGKMQHGAEYKRGVPENKLSFFYREGTDPEQLIVGKSKSKYTVHLDPTKHRLYDLAHDKDGLIAQAVQANGGAWNSDMIHSRIKQAGYHGFHNSGSALPGAVALYHPQTVTSEEPVQAHDLNLPGRRAG